MELSREEVEAAKALGCAFLAASASEVARLTMQRRIFTLDGHAFVATRDGGGFLETHATLVQLIGHGERSAAASANVAETVAEAEAADAATAREMAQEHQRAGRSAVELRHPRTVAAPRHRQNRTPRGT